MTPWASQCKRVLLIASLTLLLPACANPVTRASGAHDSNLRITSLVHSWFALLEGKTGEARDLADLVAQPSFAISSADGSTRNLAELRSWASSLRSTHLQLEFRIGPIRVDSVGDGLHRARFEFDRRALDETGIPHIARAEQIWLVRGLMGNAPAILRIDERPLLVFPGTGPRIVCS
jgi:hypothetical protein